MVFTNVQADYVMYIYKIDEGKTENDSIICVQNNIIN